MFSGKGYALDTTYILLRYCGIRNPHKRQLGIRDIGRSTLAELVKRLVSKQEDPRVAGSNPVARKSFFPWIP